jgi:hypothetical protein
LIINSKNENKSENGGCNAHHSLFLGLKTSENESKDRK